jgi:hypothetical protein
MERPIWRFSAACGRMTDKPAVVGLLNLAPIYFLYTDLRHSSWLLERKNECGNPTLYADNGFFSSSFHGFFPRG